MNQIVLSVKYLSKSKEQWTKTLLIGLHAVVFFWVEFEVYRWVDIYSVLVRYPLNLQLYHIEIARTKIWKCHFWLLSYESIYFSAVDDIYSITIEPYRWWHKWIMLIFRERSLFALIHLYIAYFLFYIRRAHWGRSVRKPSEMQVNLCYARPLYLWSKTVFCQLSCCCELE